VITTALDAVVFRLETAILKRVPRRTRPGVVTAAELIAYRRAVMLRDLDGRVHEGEDRGRCVIALTPFAPPWAPDWARDA
jgi:hypothetical protein